MCSVVAIEGIGLTHFVCIGWHGVWHVDFLGLVDLGGSLCFVCCGVVCGAFSVCLAGGWVWSWI